MKPLSKDEAMTLRDSVNSGKYGPQDPFTPHELRVLAEDVDEFATAQYMDPSVKTFGVGYYSTATKLRKLADKLEADAVEVNERLAKAGEAAADALDEAALQRARAELQKGRAAEWKKRAFNAGLSAAQLRHQLAEQKLYTQALLRVVGELLADLAEAEAAGDALDIEIKFVYGDNGGVSPEQASDLALAMSNSNGEEGFRHD